MVIVNETVIMHATHNAQYKTTNCDKNEKVMQNNVIENNLCVT